MPHQIIEYSANLEADIDFKELVRVLHETALGIDALPEGGIRTRAIRHDNYRIADGHPDNGFIYIVLRIMEGRAPEVQTAAGEQLFAALQQYVADVYERRPIALSFEIQEINPARRWMQGNIRDYMAQRGKK